MPYLKNYLDMIIERGNVGLAESISNTAEEVGNNYLKNFSFTSHEIGLLLGNVQSGKTGQMFGIMSKATDLGFPVFVLLTTDNVILQQQTLDRVKADLDGFCICGENDARVFAENSLMLPTIVVLKKNARILKLWANIFNSTDFMRGNPLFIVDDEADAASLNTLVNKNRQSSINTWSLSETVPQAVCICKLPELRSLFSFRPVNQAGIRFLHIISNQARVILEVTFSFLRQESQTV